MAYLSSLAAMLLYGGWALWVNLDADNSNSNSPAFFHGLYAAFLTWLIYKFVVGAHQRASRHTRYPGLITWIAATALSFALPLLIQTISGGVRPLATIAPGFLVGQIYIIGLLYAHCPKSGTNYLAR